MRELLLQQDSLNFDTKELLDSPIVQSYVSKLASLIEEGISQDDFHFLRTHRPPHLAKAHDMISFFMVPSKQWQELSMLDICALKLAVVKL